MTDNQLKLIYNYPNWQLKPEVRTEATALYFQEQAKTPTKPNLWNDCVLAVLMKHESNGA